MLRTLLFTLTVLSVVSVQSQIQTPDQFLGYELGSYFTRHHQVVDYFEYLGKNSSKLKLQPYGKTNEGRLLQLAFISSEDNLKNLESIRTNHLYNSGTVYGEKNNDKVKIGRAHV